MKMKLKMLPALVGLLAVGGADAATKINGDVLTFSKDAPQQILNARPDAFYNLTMGFQGWTHHSGWGNVKLKKGNLYTITVKQTNQNLELGFHPAVAVWYRPQGSGVVPNTYAYDHFYNQWANIIAKNVVDEANQAKLGTLKQYFVVNGVDRDGWDATDEDQYNQTNVQRILDGVQGKVVVQFVAKDSGWYQFVVGGINPDAGVNMTAKYPQEVTVEGF